MSKEPSQVGTNTTTSTTQVPPYVANAQQALMGAAQGMTAPFLGAPPQLVAPQSQGQYQASWDADRLNDEAFTNPANQVGSTGSWNSPGAQMGGTQLGAEDIANFFNPYQRDVVATTQQQLGEANDKQLAAIRARQGAESAYGGNRGALEESEQNRNFGNTMANTVANLNNQGWQNAANLGMGNAQMRQQTGMTNAQLAQQTGQFNADKNLAAAQLQEQFNLDYWNRRQQAMQNQMNIGTMQQAQGQREMDAPFFALNQLRSTVPAISTSGTTNTQPIYGPSGFQTALGVGTLAAGAAGAALSDRTTKKDIKKLGDDPETGLTQYTYNYKDDPPGTPKRVGPMAQDVEKVFPGSTKRIGGKLVIKSNAARSLLGI